jgi:hypothetical protein
MRKRWLINIVLLCVIVILGGLVYYTTEQEKANQQLTKLTKLDPNKVQLIRIERADKAKISLMKDKSEIWQMLTPFQLSANMIHINRLLQILSDRKYKELDVSKLAELKLDPPLAKVTFNKFTIAFGDSSPMRDHKRYILIDNKVYLVTDNFYNSLTQNATSFVSLAPLGLNSKIMELKLPDYHLAFKEKQWTLISSKFSDKEVETNQDALAGLIDQWQRLQAFKVEAYDVKTESQGEIEVHLVGKDHPLSFTILASKPDLILARRDKNVLYKIDNSQIDKLLQLPTANREDLGD